MIDGFLTHVFGAPVHKMRYYRIDDNGYLYHCDVCLLQLQPEHINDLKVAFEADYYETYAVRMPKRNGDEYWTCVRWIDAVLWWNELRKISLSVD